MLVDAPLPTIRVQLELVPVFRIQKATLKSPVISWAAVSVVVAQSSAPSKLRALPATPSIQDGVEGEDCSVPVWLLSDASANWVPVPSSIFQWLTKPRWLYK